MNAAPWGGSPSFPTSWTSGASHPLSLVFFFLKNATLSRFGPELEGVS